MFVLSAFSALDNPPRVAGVALNGAPSSRMIVDLIQSPAPLIVHRSAVRANSGFVEITPFARCGDGAVCRRGPDISFHELARLTACTR